MRPPQWRWAMHVELANDEPPRRLRAWLMVLAVGLLTAYGAVLRFYDLGAQSFWIDEGVSALNALAILQHGYPRMPDGTVTWDGFPVHYLMSIGLALAPDLHGGARWPGALAGTLLIPLVFAVARCLWRSSTAGLFAAAAVAFLAYEVAWSRQARFYAFLQLFMGLHMLSLWLALHRRSRKWMLMTCIWMAMAMATHRAGYLTLLLTVVTLAIHLPGSSIVAWRRVASWRWWWAWMILLGGVLWAIPGNAGVGRTLADLAAGSGLNYSGLYGGFLVETWGPLLVVATVGAVLAARPHPKWALPMLMAGAAYYLVISFRTTLFAFRYLLPFMMLLFPLVGVAGLLVDRVRRKWHWLLGAGLAAVLASSPCVWIPSAHYFLGPTEPQPDWRLAYEMISTRHQKLGGRTALAIASSFPMFQDLYLPDAGEKFYLPISHTGYPGEIQRYAPYTPATTIRTVQELDQFKGYVLMDDFSLNMLADPQIRNRLLSRKANAVIPGRFNIYIWLM